MTESFKKLFNDSLKKINTAPGSIIKCKILKIEKDFVLVDAGLKSESEIPIIQFKKKNGDLEIKIGDKIDVSLDAIEDGFGETLLSREKAKRHESWIFLEKANKEFTTVFGLINGKVKGGFTVEINDIRAFLPGSLVDIRPIKETSYIEGKILEFKVIKLDKKRNNVVVSRRAVIEIENKAERDQLLNNLKEGLQIKGIVKNLTDYGAFIDLGGVDGLLHITDMAWKRVKHPNEIVQIGEEISVKVLKFDREKIRVSLGLKQLSEDPWCNIVNKYPEKSKIKGKVTNLTDYGCFVEIQEGIEGLVHVSEMNWTNKNIHPSKVVVLNEIIEVVVLNIDEKRRRISLGLKQCTENPWTIFSKINKKGSKVIGKIKSITDFGIFVGLKDGIDGLIHLSDIDWKIPGEEAIKKYKKNDVIKSVLLQVDSERERISLGLKQLNKDPFRKYVAMHKKNLSIVVKIKKVNIKKKFLMVKIDNFMKGILILDKEMKKNILEKTLTFKVDDLIKVNIKSVDRKKNILYLNFIKIK